MFIFPMTNLRVLKLQMCALTAKDVAAHIQFLTVSPVYGPPSTETLLLPINWFCDVSVIHEKSKENM